MRDLISNGFVLRETGEMWRAVSSGPYTGGRDFSTPGISGGGFSTEEHRKGFFSKNIRQTSEELILSSYF